jgi:hypothetical protein
VQWIKRFILFHGKRHPALMGADEVNAFVSSLAVDRGVASATQNQALSAILFLNRYVLRDPLPWIADIVRAKRPDGVSKLVVQLLYGSGLRLLEGLQLRVKDVDFARGEVLVRDPKGRRDRGDHASTGGGDASPRSSREGAPGSRRRSAARFRRGGVADGAGAQASERRAGVGVAVGFPGADAI